MICKHCQLNFIPLSWRQKYCSDKCKKAYKVQYVLHKRAKNPEKYKQYNINYQRQNRKILSKKENIRYQTDPVFKEKKKQRAVKYHRTHLEQRHAYMKQYIKDHPEIIRANNIKSRTREPIDPEVLKAIWKRDSYKCVWCGSKKKLTTEHLTPLKRGGNNDYINLAVFCMACNGQKGRKMPLEWMFYLVDIGCFKC